MSRRDLSVTRRERRHRLAQIDVYPVTCAALSNGRTDAEILHAVIAGGARIIQLRDKESPLAELRAKAEYFREVTRKHGILLIVNDHVELARHVDADGVHLGQGDTDLQAARELLPDAIIGISSHSLEEAQAAQDAGADYVNIGPIFQTATKGGLSQFLGPEAIGQIAPSLTIPFTVMGGIHAENLDQVLAAGATRVAMVTAITQAQDISQTVFELRNRIRAAARAA